MHQNDEPCKFNGKLDEAAWVAFAAEAVVKCVPNKSFNSVMALVLATLPLILRDIKGVPPPPAKTKRIVIESKFI